MSNKVDIFGVKFDNLTTGQIAELLLSEIRKSTEQSAKRKPLIVFTPNPEIVMEAQKDASLMCAMQTADIVSADGIGIVWASKYFGTKIKERASGYDIVQELFSQGSKTGGLSAFFLGGRENAVTKAQLNMERKYDGLRILGTRDGYFTESQNESVISMINEVKPDLLLVGLGSPKQEKWTVENACLLSVKAIITVGGSFDVMSGNLKRAPKLFRKLGLEWFYRLLRQPKRIGRMARLPQFAIKVLVYDAKNNKKHNN